MWKDIQGWNGFYQVSDKGEVKSQKCIKKQGFDKNGYKTVMLINRPKKKLCKVHRLVWEAFNGPIPDGMQVNHINEDKADNRLENLNLMTPKENVNWRTGIKRSAKKRQRPVTQYLDDGTPFFTYFSIKDAAEDLSICKTTITSASNGKYKTAGGYKWNKIS